MPPVKRLRLVTWIRSLSFPKAQDTKLATKQHGTWRHRSRTPPLVFSDLTAAVSPAPLPRPVSCQADSPLLLGARALAQSSAAPRLPSQRRKGAGLPGPAPRRASAQRSPRRAWVGAALPTLCACVRKRLRGFQPLLIVYLEPGCFPLAAAQ